MKKWLAILFMLLPTMAWAQSEVKLAPAQRHFFNTFFSNFAEADVQSFKKDSMTDEALLNFALRHNYINNFKSLKKSSDGLSVIVPVSMVDETTVKYFGRKMAKHSKQSYSVPMAEGETHGFSQLIRLRELGDGLFEAEGIIYSAGSGSTVDPHGTPAGWKKAGETVEPAGAFTALIKTESRRYILLEYSVKK